jgi:hypothetical protein
MTLFFERIVGWMRFLLSLNLVNYLSWVSTRIVRWRTCLDLGAVMVEMVGGGIGSCSPGKKSCGENVILRWLMFYCRLTSVMNVNDC